MRRALLAALSLLTAASPAVCADSFAITDVRVFDGSAVREHQTVVVDGETIAAVGPDVAPPEGAAQLSGTGRTLLPGLIDCHTHVFGDALERAVQFGVTTDLDMFTDPEFAAARRQEQQAGKAIARADLLSAGFLATAAGGHGTQFGVQVPTLAGPDEAEAWVAARVAEGSDYIKIVIEDGSLFGKPLPTLDAPTVRALVEAAHRHHRLALAHVTTFERAQEALETGVDGLVHLFRDRPADARWVARAKQRGLFVVPTLTVLEGTAGVASGASLAEDDRLSPYLAVNEVANLRRFFPDSTGASLEAAFASVRALREAGIPLLAGTDAPNPGTWHGVSMHRELELLVDAGLSPAEALAAATSVPARIFDLPDRGRIAPGARADLLLVEGDPLTDIHATRAIEGVWKAGHRIERVVQATDRQAAPVLAAGPLADFEQGTVSVLRGFGWTESTDQMMGGKSTVTVEAVGEGAGDSSGALRIAGEIQAGFPYPWAGAMYFPGTQPMTPVDASAVHHLVFSARGQAGTYRVLAFALSLGPVPAQQTFEVTGDWTDVTLPLDGFPGLDPSGLVGLLWTGGPAMGPFHLEIDDVALRE